MYHLPYDPLFPVVNMDEQPIQLIYTTEDYESLGFHDCYVHGIRWSRANYSLVLDLDYIVQWIETQGTYNFWVAPAELHFENASDIKMALDWARFAPECQIFNVNKLDHRTTSNGCDEYHWEIEFAIPNGVIDLWATGFELRILSTPVLCEKQCLRQGIDCQ